MTKKLNLLIADMSNAIRPLLEDGTRVLSEGLLRAQITEHLDSHGICSRQILCLMTEHDMMMELTKTFIVNWPVWELGRLKVLLLPLAAIANQFDYEKINDTVQLRNNPCVMADNRCTLVDFKQLLLRAVFI